MAENLELCLEMAVKLAKEAGKMISEAVVQEKCVEAKSSASDLVTETDQKVEKFLFENLHLAFPHHKFIGEETQGSHKALTDDPTWIIDPVDGTLNFIHTFPHVAVSIGLAINKTIQVGVVYNPLLNRMFTACKGQGAYLNGDKIHVSKVTELSKALLVTELGNLRTPEFMEAARTNFTTLLPLIQGLRCTGSAALDMCNIACGEADAYFEFGIHSWDMAAATLIVTEAGGVTTDTEGGDVDLMSRRVLCASSPSLAAELSRRLIHLVLERD